VAGVLIDSNVLLDLFTEDSEWENWSEAMLADLARTSHLVINPIIYSEVSVHFDSVEDLDAALPPTWIRREPLPWESAFLAGRCFLKYRRQGGTRRSPLPDFYIGAHASVAGLTLLTRDARRYRTYFPKLKLIAP
jgi:predicted nucleic acid-binding protein